MTYNSSIIYPRTHLNIVIGPNGTGKSSMVAAIIIAMGGNAKVLSAQLHLRDYVKNGKDTAIVKIKLYLDNAENKIEFIRSFGRDGKSRFQIDGRAVNEKSYIERIRSFNIQVDNLCQFLPQDRVQDFAKQNPQDLLLSTMSSVCASDLIENHKRLKELQKDQMAQQTNLGESHIKLREFTQRMEVLKEQVEVITRQNNMISDKNVRIKKIAWLQFEELYMKCQEVEKDFTLAKKNHDEHKAQKDELNRNNEKVVKNRQKLEAALKKESDKLKTNSDELAKLKSEIEKLENIIKKGRDDVRFVRQTAEEQKREIEEARVVQMAYQKDYEDIVARGVSEAEIKTKIQQFDGVLSGLKEDIGKLSAARCNILTHLEQTIRPNLLMVENRLKTAESTKAMKLELLKNKYEDTYKGVMWLRNNINLFKGKVYEPLLLEINVKFRENVKHVENCIGERDLIAFACEDVDDMTLLTKKLRVEQRISCNVVHVRPATRVIHRPQISIFDLKGFGGKSYLIDCLEGPFPILNYLCEAYKIQNVLVGSDDLEMNTNELPDSLKLFFTPDNRITITQSRYSGERSVMSAPITERGLLGQQASQREIHELKENQTKCLAQSDQIQNQRVQFETKIAALEVKCKQIFKEKTDIANQIHVLNESKAKVNRHKMKIERLERDAINVEAEQAKFKARAKKTVDLLIKLQTAKVTVFTNYVQLLSERDMAKHRLDSFKRSISTIDVKLMEANENLDRATRYLDKIGRALDTTKQQCKEKQREAMKLTDNSKPSDGNRFPYKAQFDAISNSIDDLQEQISDIEDQLSCMNQANNNVLEEFKKCEREIIALKTEIENFDSHAEDVANEMKRIHQEWYPKIIEIIEQINQNFGSFMSTMNCAGEIELIRPNEFAYDQYGIEIRVKYRSNERLRALDRYVQSGGERAVAIAVYSLSLQHLSKVPFRCVDEINQGNLIIFIKLNSKTNFNKFSF